MSEKNLGKNFKKIWKHYVDNIEPKNESGIPDLHLVNGNKQDIFVELKYLEKPFIERTLPIKNTQYKWHINYKGKASFILFQVGAQYYLFKSRKIIFLMKKITWASFEKEALIKTNELEVVTKTLSNIY